MLNRFLFLLVAVISPASSVAMLFGAHPAGVVTLADRLPCLAFALVALALAALHASPTTDRSAPFEAAMWLGLATLLLVSVFASPHLGIGSVVALLTLAGTSVARLVGRARTSRMRVIKVRRRRSFA
jgi:hypothetical protein